LLNTYHAFQKPFYMVLIAYFRFHSWFGADTSGSDEDDLEGVSGAIDDQERDAGRLGLFHSPFLSLYVEDMSRGTSRYN